MSTIPLLGTVDRDSGSVHLERTLPAARREVWDALTDPTRLRDWLAPVERGKPVDGEFVLRMNDTETATCTVTAWDPPSEFRMRWDYTGEGPSELSIQLSEQDGQTRLVLEHVRIPVDPVQYGAGWHAHLDNLAAYLAGERVGANGCDDDRFMAVYRELEPRYAAAATGSATGSGAGR